MGPILPATGAGQISFSSTHAFVEDGGEFIVSLKNGMLGFYIAGRDKKRLSKVPTNPDEEDIIAGQSCMSCHAKGFIYRRDMMVEKVKENPIKVFVKALENGAPREEIVTIEYGGARYPQAVDVSPYRRVNIALRNIIHGAQDKSFNKKTKMFEALANEIVAASTESNESFAVTKKSETEKMADSAR